MNAKQKHVAFFLPDLKGGGAERVILDLAHWFTAHGYRVDLLVLKKRGEYLKEVDKSVHLKRVFGFVLPLQLLGMALYLRINKPDALLSTMIGCNLFAIVARFFSGVKPRLVLREMDTLSYRLKLRNPMIAWLYKTLARMLYHYADRVIAVSQGVAVDLARMLPKTDKRIVVVYNPTVTPRMLHLAGQRPDHPWFQDGLGSVVMSAGRLEPQKDFVTLLKAIAKVRKTQSVRLILLGKGSQKAKLKMWARALGIADAVSFAGFQSNPMAYMRAADLYVLSSRNEGMPNSLIQALACGCPVVSTNCQSGPTEVLQNGKYGKLVPVGDVDAMADAIIETLKNPLDAGVLKQAIRNFHIDGIAPEYANLLGFEFNQYLATPNNAA